ncbi:anti-sigma factor [Frigidibacter sp. MR17.14]|uniref:anti-sigma factor n=1 Tax=Frigidibacter sp. MR17.14 TaxID=3126509 RepID=UPI003012EC02
MIPSELDASLQEYVLGLLDPEEVLRLEDAIREDEALCRRVAALREQFAAIDRTSDPAATDPALWSRIEASLQSSLQAQRTETALDAAPALRRSGKPMVFAALLAVAAALAGLALVLRPAPTPDMIALLADPEGTVRFIVEDFGGNRVDLTSLAPPDLPQTASLQVWTKWSEEVGPVSLGVLDATGSVSLDTDLPAPIEGQLYEVTLEQRGGSPTGRPTGPIIGVGTGQQPG